MDINFYVKSMGSFTILSVMWYERLTEMLPIAHRPIKVQGIGKDTPSNMFSFINFEPLELYWTYFLALQTMTLKIPPMRLMSLDHELKNEMLCHEFELWALMRLYRHEFWAMGFGIIFVNMDSFGI